MFRSLHMKLVMIMVLLIVSLMTVVGAFLMNSVVSFFMEDFYSQMAEMFSQQNESFLRDLQTPVTEDEDPVEALQGVLRAYMGELGVDGRNRNYYILDTAAGRYLAGSNDELGQRLEMTPNLTTAISQKTTASRSDVTASYMDVAVYITRGEGSYIIYIKDGRQTDRELNSALFMLIVQALIFGLVISVLLSFLLAKTMITPIERLTGGVNQVAQGDFSHKIEVASRDEIGVLTTNFNSMARQLQATIREVQSERNKLDTLFLHMTDGVVAFSKEGRVIQKNPAAEDMLGQAIGEETTYDALFAFIAPLSAVLSLGQDGYLGQEKQVGQRHLELLLAPFDADSDEGGVMVVIHDVTQQRKTEEMRKEFVANVSHELRTPLTNIHSYAETLVDSAGELPQEMEKNFLSVILSESERMAHIVQDLLTLSRFDSGRSELNLERFSFDKAVREVYNAVLMEAQRHGHTVKLDLQPELPDIIGDKGRLTQVMMNVVSNSIKYTPDGGLIQISARKEGEEVWWEVADNGIGIPPQDRARIFDRFYRVDKARSRESGGTGLGLSIAKEIVDRHRGEISLVDREGPGLTVRVRLPIGGPDHGA